MSRTEALNSTLAQIQSSSADVEACAVVSEDGLIIASSLPANIEETSVAGMSAAMLSMGTRTAMELKRGQLDLLFIKGDNGYLLIKNAGPHAVLLAMARKEAKLGLIFLDITRGAQRVQEILG
ncbi:roadblock/LC7 domain-containing protein [Myxococcota bacterium]|nr:roadblock/LC7 domain-containing protein [Myxococcota bacterium]